MRDGKEITMFQATVAIYFCKGFSLAIWKDYYADTGHEVVAK